MDFVAYACPILAAFVVGMGFYVDRGAHGGLPEQRHHDALFFQASIVILALGVATFTASMGQLMKAFSNLLGIAGLVGTTGLIVVNVGHLRDKRSSLDLIVHAMLWVMLGFSLLIAAAWSYLLWNGDTAWVLGAQQIVQEDQVKAMKSPVKPITSPTTATK